MSQFTQEEQTEIVKNALELTATIQYQQNKCRKLEAQSFKKLPGPPVRQIVPAVTPVQPQYPPKPKTEYTYMDCVKETLESITSRGIPMIVIVLLAMSLCGLFIAYTLIKYPMEREKRNRELAASHAPYLAAREEAERKAQEEQEKLEIRRQKEQEELDAVYEREQTIYQTQIVPEYHEALALWEAKRQMKVDFLLSEIDLNTQTLTALYEQTKMISSHYRQLPTLAWLYEEMHTSDHDIRYATELFDRQRQINTIDRAAQLGVEAISRMEQSMMAGFQAVYQSIEDGNAIQSNVLHTLAKTRRDINIGNAAGVIQRNHTNKMLAELLPKQ